MKTRLYLACMTAISATYAAEEIKQSDFMAFQLPLGCFSLVDAQALADAKRHAMYGVCGMSVFKEKRGSIWIFTTKVGYAGMPGSDILVEEPAMKLPRFAEEKASQQPQQQRP